MGWTPAVAADMDKAVNSSKNGRSTDKTTVEAKRSHVLHVLQSSEQAEKHSYALSMRQRLAQAAGLSAVLGFILADFFTGGFESILVLDWKLVALFLPFLLLPVALTFPYPSGRSDFRQYLLISVFVLGLALASYMGLSRRDSSWFNQETLTLATIYIYFLSSLPLFRAVFCGLVAWLAFTISETGGSDIVEMFLASPYLLIANVVGGFGLLYLEWHSRERHEQEMSLRSDAMIDDLTGLLNRRAIDQHLRRVWRQAHRDHCNLCVLRLDIDHLKQLNDRVGYAMGDGALRHVAGLLEREAKRPFDAVGRSGSDEFIVVLYNCEPGYYKQMVQKLPQAATKYRLGDSMDIEPLTVSGGAVITSPQSNEDSEWEQFIEQLDENLARARLNGRNQITVTDLEQSPVDESERWNMKTAEMDAMPMK